MQMLLLLILVDPWPIHCRETPWDWWMLGECASPKTSRFPLLPAAAICLRAFGGKVPHIAMSASSSLDVCLVQEPCRNDTLLQSFGWPTGLRPSRWPLKTLLQVITLINSAKALNLICTMFSSGCKLFDYFLLNFTDISRVGWIHW